MSFCSVPTPGVKTAILLGTIEEWEGDFHLSPCERSTLLAQELYTRRQDAWGEWVSELTPKGRAIVEAYHKERQS